MIIARTRRTFNLTGTTEIVGGHFARGESPEHARLALRIKRGGGLREIVFTTVEPLRIPYLCIGDTL